MIIVTGGAGFIGSNLVLGLNQRGYNDILVVDNLTNGRKIANLSDLDIHDYLDHDDFLARLQAGQDFGPIEALFHQGACSSTTEWDGRFMMQSNFSIRRVFCTGATVFILLLSTPLQPRFVAMAKKAFEKSVLVRLL